MFEKILLAVDLNDETGTRKIAEKAGQLVRLSGAELHVLNVVPDYGWAIVGSSFGPKHSKAMLEDAEKALRAWVDETFKLPIPPQVHVGQGTIYDVIIKFAKKIDADAIIVGSHRPELKDYLVGPNAARVVRHAKRSVIVIR